MKNSQVFIKKYVSKHREKEGCSCNLYIARNKDNKNFNKHLTKTVLKMTSNAIKKLDLDELQLNK